MIALMFVAATKSFFEMSTGAGYIIGAFIAMFIIGYLFYSLVKPEKF